MRNDIQLPDFDEMMEIIDQLHSLSKRKGQLKVILEAKEADITKEAKTNSKYFDTKGSPHAQNTIDKLYTFKGFDGELVPLREEAEGVDADISYLRSKLDFYRMLVDIWRTHAANERKMAG